MENHPTDQKRRYLNSMGVVPLMVLGLVFCLFGGCASMSRTDWRGMSDMYNGQMNSEYEQMNRYRQGPATRQADQPVQVIQVQRCETWPYCPQ